ncbi:hypothetical protein H4R24_000862 [Coemansia sp. RSA 988]|nr:hypothetical protein H4R24_000862 [Coemansia sp. RSA 988]
MKLIVAITAFAAAAVVQAQNGNLDAPALPPGAYSPDFISGPGTGLPNDATDDGIALPSTTSSDISSDPTDVPEGLLADRITRQALVVFYDSTPNYTSGIWADQDVSSKSHH